MNNDEIYKENRELVLKQVRSMIFEYLRQDIDLVYGKDAPEEDISTALPILDGFNAEVNMFHEEMKDGEGNWTRDYRALTIIVYEPTSDPELAVDVEWFRLMYRKEELWEVL